MESAQLSSQGSSSPKEWTEKPVDLAIASLPDTRRTLVAAIVSRIVWVSSLRLRVLRSPVLSMPSLVPQLALLPYLVSLFTGKSTTVYHNFFDGTVHPMDTPGPNSFILHLEFAKQLWTQHVSLALGCYGFGSSSGHTSLAQLFLCLFQQWPRTFSYRTHCRKSLRLSLYVLDTPFFFQAPKKPPYEYDKLDHRKCQIRLLGCTKSSLFSQAEYSLVPAELGYAPEYDAISYTWAPEKPD